MRARVILFGLLGFLALAGFECGKPTEPPREVEPKYAYFWDRNSGSRVFEYSLSELRFSRTFDLPGNYKEGRYSTKTKKLYMFLSVSGDDSLSVFDIPSLSLDTVVDLPTQMEEASAKVSADGSKLLFLADSPVDFLLRLHVMNLDDYTVVAVDSVRVDRFGISRSGEYVFTYSPGEPIVTYRFSEKNGVYERVAEFTHSFGGTMDITGTNDGDRIFLLYRSGSSRFNFAELDATSGAPRFDSVVAGGYGRIALTSVGSYAFLTNPSTIFFHKGDSKIRVYDASRRTIIETIRTDSMLDAYPDGIKFGDLFVSANDSLLIGGIPAFGLGDYGIVVSIPDWSIRDIFRAPDSSVNLWLLGVD